MLRRRLLLGKSVELQSGNKLCKYLRSTGAQFVTTNIKISNFFRIRVKARILNFGSDFGASIIGSYNINTGYRIYPFGIIEGNNQTGIRFSKDNWNSKSIVPGIGDDFDFTVSHDQSKMVILQTSYGASLRSTVYDFDPADQAYINLFTCGYTSLHNDKLFDIYNVDIFDGEKNWSFIPILDKNGVACMYETVSKECLYNNGTGTFGYELMDGTYVAPQ